MTQRPAAYEVFEVEIRYSGDNALDFQNPIEVFIGDFTVAADPEYWGQYKVRREGTY